MWRWIVSLIHCRGKHRYILHFLGEKEDLGMYSLWTRFSHFRIVDSGFRSLHAGGAGTWPRNSRS